MKRVHIAWVVGVLGLLFAGFGGIRTINLGTELRTHTQVIPTLENPTTSDTTVGSSGVAVAKTVGAIDSGGATVSADADIGALPYPGRLVAQMVDADSGETVTCNARIWGKNQHGVRVSEVLTSVGEASSSTTTNAYESISRVVLSSCSNTEASDRFHLYLSDWVAVDRVLLTTSDIVSICQRDPNADEDTTCVEGDDCTVHKPSGSVDILACTSLSAAAQDGITIRSRTLFR